MITPATAFPPTAPCPICRAELGGTCPHRQILPTYVRGATELAERADRAHADLRQARIDYLETLVQLLPAVLLRAIGTSTPQIGARAVRLVKIVPPTAPLTASALLLTEHRELWGIMLEGGTLYPTPQAAVDAGWTDVVRYGENLAHELRAYIDGGARTSADKAATLASRLNAANLLLRSR